MTMYDFIEVACSCCGKKSRQRELVSSYVVSAGDMDGRPGIGLRETLGDELHRCPACGYVRRRLDLPPARGALIGVPGIDERGFPERAREYLIAAGHDAAHGEVRDAAEMAMGAAWVLDDANRADEASKVFAFAADLLAGAIHNDGAELSPEKQQERVHLMLILADLQRRAGRFEQAHDAIERAAGGGTRVVLEAVHAAARIEVERWAIAGRKTEAISCDAVAAVEKAEECAKYLRELNDADWAISELRDRAALLSAAGISGAITRYKAAEKSKEALRMHHSRVLSAKYEAEEARRLATARRIFELAESHAGLRRVLKRWPNAATLARSGLTLLDKAEGISDAAELASIVRDEQQGKCPKCGFGYSLTVVNDRMSCGHCGWRQAGGDE